MCTVVSVTIRVCDINHGDRGLELVLFNDGQPTRLADGRPSATGRLQGALAAHLDADGSEELVVVDHVGTSNGMAMTLDRLWIIADYTTAGRSWLSFTVNELGSGPGTFVQRADLPGTWILSSEWERSETLDPQRGYGTYLVGRWFRYEKKRLVSEPGVIVRRLLNSFADERSRDMDHQPYSFFMNGKGRAVERDPAFGSGEVIGTLRGTISRVIQGDASAEYELVLADGRRTRATFAIPYGADPPEHIDHVALGAINRVLPAGVPPSAVVGDVTGRTVRLTRYKDGRADKRVLWID